MEQLAGEAKRNGRASWIFVLAGDILDLHRSGLWFTENQQNVRPYVSNSQITPQLGSVHPAHPAGHRQRGPCQGGTARVPLLAGGRYLDAAAQGETVSRSHRSVHYIPGNHDRLANASPAIRKAARQALGLPEHGAAFPNVLAFDQERALVRHGHEYDYANFSVDLRQERAYPDSSSQGILPGSRLWRPGDGGHRIAAAHLVSRRFMAMRTSWPTRRCAHFICAC